jgi:hypothetical protein
MFFSWRFSFLVLRVIVWPEDGKTAAVSGLEKTDHRLRESSTHREDEVSRQPPVGTVAVENSLAPAISRNREATKTQGLHNVKIESVVGGSSLLSLGPLK